MANCLYPNCGKAMVGSEKLLCKSCRDKIKRGAWRTVKWTGTALLALLTIIPTAMLYLKGKK
jgi:hypothetical protein